MSRELGPDDICGLCDEFDVDQAAPECTAKGMGRCLVHDEAGPLELYVPWDGRTCVSFRLDHPNLQRKRQFVEVQRRTLRVDADESLAKARQTTAVIDRLQTS